jgi:NAD(P)-dependent dehydrogenase (short-subunit alcohol dehydrogenase family)
VGRGIAIAYGRAGINVCVVSRTKSKVDSVVDEITREGGSAFGISCDVGVREQVFDAVDQAAKRFGTVDILLNNAQSYAKPGKPPEEWNQPLEIFDEEDWDVVYRTGLMATLWGMKAAFPYMKDRGGKIINFGSTAGQTGGAGLAAYSTFKEGIRGLTRTAAREWGPYKITVNVVNPMIRTETVDAMERERPDLVEQLVDLKSVPLRRWGDPIADGGGLALFLASSASDYLTGMTFMLNGGNVLLP